MKQLQTLLQLNDTLFNKYYATNYKWYLQLKDQWLRAYHTHVRHLLNTGQTALVVRLCPEPLTYLQTRKYKQTNITADIAYLLSA